MFAVPYETVKMRRAKFSAQLFFINDPKWYILRAEGLLNVDETIQGGFAD